MLQRAFPFKSREFFVSLTIYDMISKIDTKSHNEKLTSSIHESDDLKQNFFVIVIYQSFLYATGTIKCTF